MKTKYIQPSSDPVEIDPRDMLLQSGSIDASGQDFNDPIIVDYDDIF